MDLSIKKNGIVTGSLFESLNSPVSFYKNDITINPNLFNGATASFYQVSYDSENKWYTFTTISGNTLYRIQGFGLYGEGNQYYTVSYEIKSTKNYSIYTDLCDTSNAPVISLTSDWQKVSFQAMPSNYYNPDLSYNGFLDFEYYGSDYGGTVYVRNIKIEKGYIEPTPYIPYGMVQNSAWTSYDNSFYTEPDGTVWARVCHHNAPASNLFESSGSFASGYYKDINCWFNVGICNNLNIWELMVKQKATSDSTEEKYRWIQNVNPMTASYSQVGSSNITKNLESGYSNWSHGGLYHIGGNTHLATNNDCEGNWWGAVGSWTSFGGGIPGWNSVCPSTGYLDLYVRIPWTNSEMFTLEKPIGSNNIIEI